MNWDQLPPQLQVFEKAFSTNGGGCVRDCDCGRVFYSTDDGWDWDDGEFERLQKSKATALPYTVTTLRFENKEYVSDCDCWHARAKMIMGFLAGHGDGICRWFELEKERAVQKAARMPVVAYNMEWRSMDSAPRNATWVMVKTADGKAHRAHFAEDVSGEEQPPFSGWFKRVDKIDGFVGLGSEPIMWRPCSKDEND